ncbi:PulJ/GspJ family protein [Maridesulfovibrio bastinii]|uniref:PulJ/GspJ family protein n=1 Tax=Maridesulfovibrio bastinii TaxID=47157 RepID=UPI0003FA0928|nr:prepilin-type N-terminal cleavage/methylation domain-containing protein [Maridesulfovibrio bastinii]
MKDSATNNAQGGFTLLEILLAMVLSVIVITAMSGIFRSAVDSSIAVNSEVRMNQEGRVLISIMQKDLSSVALSDSKKIKSDDSRLYFRMSVGEISTEDYFMTFATTNDVYSKNSDTYPINWVRYKLEKEENDLYSFYRINRQFAYLSGQWQVQSLKLADNIESFETKTSDEFSNLTVENNQLRSLKTIEISFSILENGRTKDYSLIVPVKPCILTHSTN